MYTIAAFLVGGILRLHLSRDRGLPAYTRRDLVDDHRTRCNLARARERGSGHWSNAASLTIFVG
jgi:hypothetical protein